MTDPLKRMLAELLTAAGIRFTTNHGDSEASRSHFDQKHYENFKGR